MSYIENQVDAVFYPIALIVAVVIVVLTWLTAMIAIIATLLMMGVIIAALGAAIFAIVSITIAIVRYYAFRGQALADSEAELAGLGWSINPDDVFRVAFGVDNFSPKGRSANHDWLDGIVLGIDDEE